MSPDEPETTAVAVRQAEPNPLAMIAIALERGMPPDQLGKLYDLHERNQKDLAARAFADAITRFQAECPAIPKGRAVKDRHNVEKYKFANYDDISHIIAPLLAKHGIVVTFDSMPVEGLLLVTCRVRVGTHTEASGATVPIPAAGQMTNETQSLGSAISYGKRYAIGLALNIRFTGEDDDGHASNGRRPQRQAQPQRETPFDGDFMCGQAIDAFDDAQTADQQAEVWGQVYADRHKFSADQWDLITAASDKAKTRLASPKPKAAEKPAENLSLTEILTRMHKSTPADAADLCTRLKWLSGALARRLPDFAEQELFDVIEQAVIMPSSNRMTDLTRDQCGPAWVAVKGYVEQAAKLPAKAGVA